MERSSTIERERHELHPVSPMVYQMQKVHWDIFGSLTFRTVPPDHIQRRCIFEFIRRCLKKFTCSEDFHWSTPWVFRQEHGEKNGRVHWHFLMVLDKPQPNWKTTCHQMSHIWEKEVASRFVGRYNEEREKHDRVLRKELAFKPYGIRQEELAARSRPKIRNDYSSPGYTDIRQFNPHLGGVDYIMKGEDWTYSGANAYELSKFNEREGTIIVASHKLLMRMYLKMNGKTSVKDKAIFHQGLVDRTSSSHYVLPPEATFLNAPDRPKQLWDPSPEYSFEEWSLDQSQY